MQIAVNKRVRTKKRLTAPGGRVVRFLQTGAGRKESCHATHVSDLKPCFLWVLIEKGY